MAARQRTKDLLIPLCILCLKTQNSLLREKPLAELVAADTGIVPLEQEWEDQ